MNCNFPLRRTRNSLLKERKTLLLLFFLVLLPIARTQNNSLGSWNILNAKYNWNTKFNFFAEAQLRSLRFYSNYHYYEVKGGIEYKFVESFKLSLGAGSYQTYGENGSFSLPKNNDEFRVWPQLTFNQKIGPFKVEQRYRAELRFTSNGYRNRFRYRLGLSHSFGKAVHSYQPFSLSISNELFFTNREPYFERNRLMFAFNYKPSAVISLQCGYIHQFDYKINDETGTDFLVLGLYFEFNRNASQSTQ